MNISTHSKAFLAALCIIVSLQAQAQAQTVKSTGIKVESRPAARLELTEVLRIGSLTGPNDDFGRIMGLEISGSGNIFVADDLNHRVAVFSGTGRFLRSLGSRGRGPGEFESPWLVAVDPRDSVFVWDISLSRISVFAPELSYVRDFPVPPHWIVNGLEFLPDGKLLFAAFGRGETGILHVADRKGRVERSFGPMPARSRDLAGFESSLLGGSVDLSGDVLAYTRKSPYEVMFFRSDGTLLTRCVGRADWTTRPEDVVVRRAQGVGLNFKAYIHSSRILDLGNGLYLNTIHDPVNNRRILDVLSRDCRLQRRQVLKAPISIETRKGRRVGAVQTLEYPQVVIYESRVRR